MPKLIPIVEVVKVRGPTPEPAGGEALKRRVYALRFKLRDKKSEELEIAQGRGMPVSLAHWLHDVFEAVVDHPMKNTKPKLRRGL